MKANWFLLVRFGIVFLSIAVPLPAQQQDPPISQRVTSPPHAAQQATAHPAQGLERSCRKLIEPLDIKETGDALAYSDEVDYLDANKSNLGSDEKARSYLEGRSEAELLFLEMQLRECVTGLPSRRLRRDAFEAHQLVREEQEGRFSDTVLYERRKEHEQYEAELKKQHDDFLEAAKFAAALYKENEQRKEENLNLMAAFNEESRRYHNLNDAVQQVIDVAGQLLNRSRRASMPAFADVQVPQVIRIETPAVPRALHCTANTTPNLSMSSVVSTSATWINCW